MRAALVALAAAVLLAGCAGRQPRMIDIARESDEHLTCTDLAREIALANHETRALRHERREAHDRNIGLGLFGAFFFPSSWFAIDTTNAEVTEMSALHQRVAHLRGIAARKGCGQMP